VDTSSSSTGTPAPGGPEPGTSSTVTDVTDNTGGAPEPFTVTLGDLLHAFGGRWQITAAQGIAGWIAVERPSPTALHVLAAPSLEQLAAKLLIAGGGDDA
jgi:hypothetical protein